MAHNSLICPLAPCLPKSLKINPLHPKTGGAREQLSCDAYYQLRLRRLLKYLNFKGHKDVILVNKNAAFRSKKLKNGVYTEGSSFVKQLLKTTQHGNQHPKGTPQYMASF
jgi:hypothetical protein